MAIIATYAVPHPPLIIPEVGGGEEQKIVDTIKAYETISNEISELNPDLIIISSPHSQLYRDYFQIEANTTRGNLSQFRAPEVQINITLDSEAITSIEQVAKKHEFPMGTKGQSLDTLDHGIMVPLYFITKYITTIPFVFISPAGESLAMHYQAGKIVKNALKNKNIIWVASGDLSHKLKETGPYGYAKEGPELDKQITTIFQSTDFSKLLSIPSSLRQKGADCGVGSFTMMAGALDGYDVKSKLLSYEGPFGVGYAVASFKPQKENKKRQFLNRYNEEKNKELYSKKQQEDAYVALARKSVEYYVKHKKQLPLPNSLPKELTDSKAGVFVTLHKDGNLRGCIGTTKPYQDTIAEEIIHNAISSCSRDYRFSKVTKQELNQLTYSVDVLFPPEPIDSMDELDPDTFGVIVSTKNKSGLLLPNLDGVDTVKKQVDIAKRKARIKDNEPYNLERFKVIRHH